MKKLLLIVGLVLSLSKLWAVTIVPGSSFPIVTTPSNYLRFLLVDTNGTSSSDPNTKSNATIRFDDLANAIAVANGSIDQTKPILVITGTNTVVPFYSFSNAVASAGSNIVYLNIFTNDCQTNMIYLSVGQSIIGRSREKSIILTESDSGTPPGSSPYYTPGALALSDNCVLENFSETPKDNVASVFPITAVNTQRRFLRDTGGGQTPTQFASTSTNVVLRSMNAYGGKNWTIVADGTNNTSWSLIDCFVQNEKLVCVAFGTVQEDFGVTSEGTTNSNVPLQISGVYSNTITGGNYSIRNERAILATPSYSAPFYVKKGILILNGPNCYISSSNPTTSTNYASCAIVSGSNTVLFANPASVSSQGTYSNAPDIIFTPTSTNCTVYVASPVIRNVRDLGTGNKVIWSSSSLVSAVSATTGATVTITTNGNVINYQVGASGGGAVLPPNAKGLLSNDGLGNTNWYSFTNVIVLTNNPTFTIGQMLVITGTNANGSLNVKGTNIPSSGSGTDTPWSVLHDANGNGLYNISTASWTNSANGFASFLTAVSDATTSQGGAGLLILALTNNVLAPSFLTASNIISAHFISSTLLASTDLEADANKQIISLANALGIKTNSGSGSGWSTSVPGTWTAAGTLPFTAADNTWYSLTNVVGWTNQPTFTAGQTLVITGTNAQGVLMVKATNFPSGGGSQTPWTTDIDGAGKNLTNANNVSVTGGVWFTNASGFVAPLGIYGFVSTNSQFYTGFGVSLTLLARSNGVAVPNQLITDSVVVSNVYVVGGPISLIPTNASPIQLYTNSPGTLPMGITNVASGRGQPVIQYYVVDAVTGTPILTVSNEQTGVKMRISNGALAFVETNFTTLPITTTNSVWRLRDESAGTGASVGVLTNWIIGL